MPLTYDIDRSLDLMSESAGNLGVDTFRIDPLRDVRWKTFIGTHAGSSVFHRVEWLQALAATYGYRPFVFTTTPPGFPLQNGVLLCEVRSRVTGNRLVSLPFSDHCEPLMSHPESVDDLFSKLIHRVATGQWKYIELRPVCYSPSTATGLGLSTTYHLHRLDLRPDEKTLYKGFHKDSIQRKIVRAEREGLRCEQGSCEELLKAFYQLLLKTRRRHGIPPQPRKWFLNLIAAFGADLKIRVAFKNETPVASILTIRHNKTLVYKYGCSDSRCSNLGGTPFLFWHAIRDARAGGMEELDMGRSDWSNQGLIRFKEHWGARRSTLKYWRYPATMPSSRWQALASHAKRVVMAAPDCVLMIVANLAYRHIA